jgi:AcrR family transcriptional regulator
MSSNRLASPRVRKRNEARRLEILHAAARAFRRLGLSAVGMRDIAEEANLSPGNLYHYFRGKDEILLFCQQCTLDQLIETVDRVRRSGAPIATQLRDAIRGHVHCMLGEMEGATAHFEVEALPEELRAPIIAQRDAYERAIRDLVVQGVERNEFAPCDAVLVTRAVLGAVNWTARWYRPDGMQSVEEIAHAMANYLVRGLLAAPPIKESAMASTAVPEALP